MNSDTDFPALYRSANDLSVRSQKLFFIAIGTHLILLIFVSFLSTINTHKALIASLQLIGLLGSLGCSIYLFSQRPDRAWYAGRAAAESIKTVAWRFATRAEPYQSEDRLANLHFRLTLQQIIEQNKEIFKQLSTHLDGRQVTDWMTSMRRNSLELRKSNYAKFRIKDQLSWYAGKATYNRHLSHWFFWALVGTNALAVVFAVIKLATGDLFFSPIDILTAIAASLLGWMQAKRYSELAASYALTAHEISLINEQSMSPKTEQEFSQFVGDTENAFSREHTQWIARRDT